MHRLAWATSEKTACDIHAGIKLHLSCTVVCHHVNVSNPERCFVRLYKLCNSCYPLNHPNNAYYLKPVKNRIEDHWYTKQPLEHWKTQLNGCVNKLYSWVSTNHSLRATTTTRLHQSGCVEEQEIMQRAGHTVGAPKL